LILHKHLKKNGLDNVVGEDTNHGEKGERNVECWMFSSCRYLLNL